MPCKPPDLAGREFRGPLRSVLKTQEERRASDSEENSHDRQAIRCTLSSLCQSGQEDTVGVLASLLESKN